jgi:ribosomal protein S18 acetylase RimI-like enzyme
MVRDLALEPERDAPGREEIETVPREQWTSLFRRVCGSGATHGPAHDAMLEILALPAYPLVLHAQGTVAAVALGVLEDGLLGIFELACAREMRRRGLATRLVRRLMRMAGGLGCSHVYLQVEQRNEPARALYRGLGFRELYSYSYRVQGSKK